MYDNQITNPDYCVKTYYVSKQIVDTEWCIAGVKVIKREWIDSDSNEVMTTAFSDWSDGTWWSLDCADISTRYDWETLCDPTTWDRVHVRMWYRTDGTILPTTAFLLDMVTPYLWVINDLVSCGWPKEQFDYEDQIVYDNCEAVIQTIVRDSDNPLAIASIWYTKLDWSAHTLVWPISELPCWSSTPLVISSQSLTSWSSLTIPVGTQSADISVIQWDCWFMVDWTIPVVWDSHIAQEGQKIKLQIQDEVNKFSFVWNPNSKIVITYYDKPLLLSQQ